jgi:hypothetical protein
MCEIWCKNASDIVGDVAPSLLSSATLVVTTEIDKSLIAKASMKGNIAL